MKVLVDTSVWSLALRRHPQTIDTPIVTEFKQLVFEAKVQMIGPIRQEILSGITNSVQFERLKEKLQAFEDLPLTTRDYEFAAEMFNTCRQKGIQGSHIDFLICSAAKNNGLLIFTTDKDFIHYSKHLSITLYQAEA